jgi:hypothetical protein
VLQTDAVTPRQRHGDSTVSRHHDAAASFRVSHVPRSRVTPVAWGCNRDAPALPVTCSGDAARPPRARRGACQWLGPGTFSGWPVPPTVVALSHGRRPGKAIRRRPLTSLGQHIFVSCGRASSKNVLDPSIPCPPLLCVLFARTQISGHANGQRSISFSGGHAYCIS